MALGLMVVILADRESKHESYRTHADDIQASAVVFAQFNDGKPANEAVHKTCLACHALVKDRDFGFTRYSRWDRPMVSDSTGAD